MLRYQDDAPRERGEHAGIFECQQAALHEAHGERCNEALRHAVTCSAVPLRCASTSSTLAPLVPLTAGKWRAMPIANSVSGVIARDASGSATPAAPAHAWPYWSTNAAVAPGCPAPDVLIEQVLQVLADAHA